MATRVPSFTDLPIIIILGSTATGKSKLGIGLAKALNGEIISADSMQVHKGLDIITNKVTADEQRQVPHHMINIISPPQEFTVVHFKKMAFNVIEDLELRKKLPIVVGGTNYYIEALLWNFLVSKENGIDEGLQERKGMSSVISHTEETVLPPSNSHIDVYERLRKVDPERAAQLHPNNIRKTARSLQIYNDTGKRHSDLLDEQKEKHGSSHLSGPLRFSKALVFWLTCNQDVLDQRISDRMETMVTEGLKHEISEFYRQYRSRNVFPVNNTTDEGHAKEKTGENYDNVENSTSSFQSMVSSHVSNKSSIATSTITTTNTATTSDATTTDQCVPDTTQINPSQQDDPLYEEGLLQAIGYKEFHSFITSNEEDPDKLETLFRDGLERLKKKTIRYSKKQRTWVRNRFLARPDCNVPNIYELNATNLDEWNENVLQRSLQISRAFIAGENIPFLPMDKLSASLDTDKNRMHVCEVCNGKIIIGDDTLEAHVASKKHRKLVGKKRKLDADALVGSV